MALDDRIELRPGASNLEFLPTANDYDPDGTVLTLIAVTQPAQGVVTQLANGTLRYVPAPGYLGGTDAFMYTVQDGEGLTATATVTLVTEAALGRDWTSLGGGPERRFSYPGAWTGQLQKKWEFLIADPGQPIIASGRMVVAGNPIRSLDANSGALAWTSQSQSQGVAGLASFGVAVFGTRVDSTTSRSFVSLQGTDGALRWATSFPGQSRNFGAPAVDATAVYHGGGSSPIVLSSLNPNTGASQFQVPVETSEQWAPSLDASGLYTCINGRFRRHDPGTGAIDWELVLNAAATNSSTPVLDGRRAYVYSQSPQGGMEIVAIHLATRTVSWRLGASSAPAVKDGLVYLRAGVSVTVLSGATGQILHQFSTPASTFFGLTTGPFVTADRIIVGGFNGSFAATTFILDRASGTLVQSLSGTPTAVADDTVYTADTQRVSAYGPADPSNHVPVAQAAVISLVEDTETSFQLAASDADGDPLSFAIRSLPASGTLYQTPDGVTRGAPINAVPAAVTNEQARLIYVARPNAFGSAAASFTFTAHDRLSSSATATVVFDIANVNDGPLAFPDLVALRPGQVLTDFDPTLNDRDYDGEKPTLVSFTQPAQGVVDRQRNGLLRYQPAPGFVAGTDSFTYTIADTAGLTSTASVTLVVGESLGNDWLTFGGSAARTGYQPIYLAGAVLTQRWQRDLGAPGTQVSVQNGGAYLAWGPYSSGARLSRFDALTGAEIWRTTYGTSTAFNQPTVQGGRVFAHPFSNLALEARATSDGSLLWASSSGVSVGNPSLAPAADDLGVFLHANQMLFGFSATSGSTLFGISSSYESLLTPALYEGNLYNYIHGVVRRHHRTTGATLWSVDLTWGAFNGNQNRTLALADGRAFVVNEGTAVNLGTTLELVAVDLNTQSVSWRIPGPYVGTPAAAHGAVYAIKGSAVIAHDAVTGFAFATYSAPSNAALRVQPIVTNDSLIVGTTTETFIFDLASRTLRQTIPFGGELSLSGRTLFLAGSDNILRTFAIPTPGNQPPIASAAGFSGPEDVPLVVTLTGTDPDNDPLSYVVTRLPSRGRLYQTSDGVTLGPPLTEVPVRVTSAAGQLIYVPVPDEFGSPLADFRCFASDGKDLSAEVTVALTITPVNDGPVARDDFRQVVPGQILSPVQERLNDSDVDGDLLTIVAFTQPNLGRVFQNADGTLRYHAPAGVETAQDQFTYTVRDPAGLQSSATVFLEIVPSLQGLWPGYGNGPSHTNSSSALLGRGSLSQRWGYNSGNSTAMRQVAVGGGRVYATTSAPPFTVTALSETTGGLLWQRNLNASGLNPPSYENGRVYIHLFVYTGPPPFGESQVLCLDAATGTTIWSTTGSSPLSQTVHGPTVGPLGVYTQTNSGGFAGFQRNTGQQLFTSLVGAPAGPWAPGLDQQGRLYSLVSGVFRAHDPVAGTVLWSYAVPQGTTALQGSPPLVGGRAYLHGGGLRALDLATQTEVWSVLGGAAFSGDPAFSQGVLFSAAGGQIEARSTADGRLLTSYTSNFVGPMFSQALVTDELVIGLASPYGTFTIDRATRSQVQSLPVGRVSIAGDSLYLATDNGQVLRYAAPPAISFFPPSGSDSSTPLSVTLTAASAGTLYYTLDGSAPGLSSPTLASGGSVVVNASGRVRAILVNGSSFSQIQEASYAIADTDADGLPDWWELQTFGGLGVAGPATDTDGDGFSDRAEFLAGTDPLSPADSFRARAASVSGGIELSFPTKPGRIYQVEETSDLQTWTPLGAPATGTGGTLTQPVPISSSQRIYRVRASPY